MFRHRYMGAYLFRRCCGSARENIDHPKGGHDDMANSIAGVAWKVLGDFDSDWQMRWVDDVDEADPGDKVYPAASVARQDTDDDDAGGPLLIPGTNGANFDNPVLAVSGTPWVPDYDGV